MSFLKILHYPDEKLRVIAQPVNKIDDNIHKIIHNMITIMNQEEGIGLAATQINIPLQIIVVKNTKEKKENLILINPRIVNKNGFISIEEGCLSIPEYRAFIPRSKYITVEAININGKKIEIKAKSILSICIQHEIDHLIGKLFIDYLSDLKKSRIHKKFMKIKKNIYLKELNTCE